MATLPDAGRGTTHMGKPTPHRKAIHLDFTPMVDLGFLLITFFMLTTSLAKPQLLPLVMPDDSGPYEPIKQSRVLTLLLGAGDKVYWYEGMDRSNMDSTGFEASGLRRVILNKMGKVASLHGTETYKDMKHGEIQTGSRLNVIIKPGPESRYNNLVDALDEMAICQVRYYCIMNPDALEMPYVSLK